LLSLRNEKFVSVHEEDFYLDLLSKIF